MEVEKMSDSREKRDLRVERTYKLLIDALMQLMTEKHFEEITVGELCERAMVRRATFYTHFGDKYELFTFMIREVKEQFAENLSQRNDNEIVPYYIGILSQMMDFLEQKREMISTIFSSSVAHVLMDIFVEQIKLDIWYQLREKAKKGEISQGTAELKAVQYAVIIAHSAKWWLENYEKLSKNDVIRECTMILSEL